MRQSRGKGEKAGIDTGSPAGGLPDMVERKRKDAGGFLDVGAFRQGRAAAVELPRKLINNESRTRAHINFFLFNMPKVLT